MTSQEESIGKSKSRRWRLRKRKKIQRKLRFGPVKRGFTKASEWLGGSERGEPLGVVEAEEKVPVPGRGHVIKHLSFHLNVRNGSPTRRLRGVRGTLAGREEGVVRPLVQ